MLINRRSFLTGLLAAPIILRPGIIMPVRALGDGVMLHASTHPLLPDGTMIVTGRDYYGHEIVEVIRPSNAGQKLFNYISAIEYVGEGVVGDHPCVGVHGNFTAVNMRRTA